MNIVLRNLLAGSAIAALAGAAVAEELSYGGGWPPNSGPTAALETYAKAIEENSGGEVTMKVYPLSLISFAEANAGVKDGLADMATILTPYFSAEFPTLNMISEFSAMMELNDLSSDMSPYVYAAAMSEYILMHCEDCQKEIAAQNQVYMGAASTSSYALQCMTPVTSPEELKGKRVRTGGAYWSRWAQAMGAVSVSISINETFEGLSQGVLDCTASNPAELTSFAFMDVVKHIYTGMPGGQFTVPTTINRDRWRELSSEGRAAIMKANARLAAEMNWTYTEESNAGLAGSRERGIDVTRASDGLIAANEAFIQADLSNVVTLYREKFGVENGDAAIAKIRELAVRWNTLMPGVETVDQLAELYWNEIYSKIDTETYGM